MTKSSTVVITFHVHLPSFDYIEGYPVVVGNIRELGNWKEPIIKLNQQKRNENELVRLKSSYWYSDTIFIPTDRFNNYEVKYNYALFIPTSNTPAETEAFTYEEPEDYDDLPVKPEASTKEEPDDYGDLSVKAEASIQEEPEDYKGTEEYKTITDKNEGELYLEDCEQPRLLVAKTGNQFDVANLFTIRIKLRSIRDFEFLNLI